MCIPNITLWAGVEIPWASTLEEVSITPPAQATADVGIDSARSIGGMALSIARIIIWGCALIYIVLVWANMIIHSDSEDMIAKQKKQILYIIIGFMFLNVPTLIYDVFLGANEGAWNIDTAVVWSTANWSSPFWSDARLGSTVGSIIAFLRVVVFGVAVVMFTWWAFSLIASRGHEEVKTQAINRLIYGALALIFMWLVEVWVRMLSWTGWKAEIWLNAKAIFGLALFFAAPIAVFFLIIGAYYYITSGWEEERAKKWKKIIINTLIATFILLASLTMVQQLAQFQF